MSESYADDPTDQLVEPSTREARRLRFDQFEVDLRSREVYRSGRRLRLPDKPFRVLAVLLERPGDVVLREELQRRLWPSDTFVDFDHNLNTAVNKLRERLGDSAERPRFIETLPRRGYRWLVPVEGLEPTPAKTEDLKAPSARRRLMRPTHIRAVVLALLVIASVGLLAVWWTGWRRDAPFRDPQRLLVMPFENLTGNEEDDFLSDGMTESSISRLASLRPETLRVVARTSAMQLKGIRGSLADLAHRVDADLLLTGAVQRAGDRIRVSAQLVRVADELTLWSDTFDGARSDVFVIQSRVSAAAAQHLVPDPSGTSNAHSAHMVTDASAYEAYLKARYLLDRGRPEGIRDAIALLVEATTRDPKFLEAWVSLGDAYYVADDDARETYTRSKEAVERALALDHRSPEALHRLAAIQLYREWDWTAAAKTLDQALALGSGLTIVHQTLASSLALMGRHEEALAEMEEARRLDPIAVTVAADSCWYLYVARRFDQATRQCKSALELEPNHDGAQQYLILVEAARGDSSAAVSWALRRMRSTGASPVAIQLVERAAPRDALRQYWRWHRDMLTDRQSTSRSSPGVLALTSVLLGEHDRAFAELEEEYARHAGWVLPFMRVYPVFDAIRHDPRFSSLEERMSFPRP